MFAKKKKLTVKIEGMGCQHCVTKIENALKEMDEIEKAKVSLEKKEAEVTLEKEIDPNKIKKAVEELGYEVVSIEE